MVKRGQYLEIEFDTRAQPISECTALPLPCLAFTELTLALLGEARRASARARVGGGGPADIINRNLGQIHCQ